VENVHQDGVAVPEAAGGGMVNGVFFGRDDVLDRAAIVAAWERDDAGIDAAFVHDSYRELVQAARPRPAAGVAGLLDGVVSDFLYGAASTSVASSLPPASATEMADAA